MRDENPANGGFVVFCGSFPVFLTENPIGGLFGLFLRGLAGGFGVISGEGKN